MDGWMDEWMDCKCSNAFFLSGGYYSDTLAYVSKQCRKCPNGTFVSDEKRPGKRAQDCVACPQG